MNQIRYVPLEKCQRNYAKIFESILFFFCNSLILYLTWMTKVENSKQMRLWIVAAHWKSCENAPVNEIVKFFSKREFEGPWKKSWKRPGGTPYVLLIKVSYYLHTYRTSDVKVLNYLLSEWAWSLWNFAWNMDSATNDRYLFRYLARVLRVL